jgi:hypothetical protein
MRVSRQPPLGAAMLFFIIKTIDILGGIRKFDIRQTV